MLKIARRSEDRSRAVWTLIAVAVSIAKSLCIYRDPVMAAGREESFFDQQMRRRLWLTTCLIDFQASFGLTSEPLISLEEATSSFVLPRHVNDADFDQTTQYPIPVREGLTDTTFALVTYHAQLSGRLLNSVAAEKSRAESVGIANGQHAASTSSNNASNIEAERQQHAQRFKQEALKLLHFCDPESSPYAWFTWHGTQCILAGVRLFELRPLQWARIGKPVPLQSAEDDSELLQLTLRFLEKAQLMLTDPRGEGFRWYIVVPWHALAIAIAQCYVCTDTALVRQVWPLIEASYHHLETATAKSASGTQQNPLGKLMHQTREKLEGFQHFDHIAIENPYFSKAGLPAETTHLGANAVLVENSTLSPWSTIPSPSNSDSIAGPAYSLPAALLPQQRWNPPWQSLQGHPMITSTPTLPMTGLSPSPQDILDQSWRPLEEVVPGIHLNEFAIPGLYCENDLDEYIVPP